MLSYLKVVNLTFLSQDFEEPIPLELSTILLWLKNEVFVKFNDSFVLDACGQTFSLLDLTYYSNYIPSSIEVINVISKAPEISSVENGLVVLLKIIIDREISNMPRSLFLGKEAPKSFTLVEKFKFDDELCKRLLTIVRNQLKMVPFFFGTFSWTLSVLFIYQYRIILVVICTLCICF